MKTLQIILNGQPSDKEKLNELKQWQAQLVLAFGNVKFFKENSVVSSLYKDLGATIVGCSSAGEISTDGTYDQSLILTGIKFSKATFKTALSNSSDISDSTRCGEQLGQALKANDLKSVLLFGKGLQINGGALTDGIRKALSPETLVTGGLAGDSGEFKQTYVVQNDKISSDAAVALGLYGDALEISFGFGGGWEPFGPTRKITKAVGTQLFEIDGEKALNVYKSYLKDFAKDLPASALLFPFAVLDNDQATTGLIRTILGIDEATGSLYMAGDMHEGQLIRLMHTSNRCLIKGVQSAVDKAKAKNSSPSLTVAVSCVGRKLVLGEDLEEEIEVLQNEFSESSITGFYSYGEIGPFRSDRDSHLHNQTMTVTCIREKE